MSALIPARLRMLMNLTTLLETITPENGYYSDLRGRVFRGRAQFGDSDPVPMVSILEAVKVNPGLPAPPDAEQNRNVLSLLIQGWVDDDVLGNPTDPVYYLLADVKQALAKHKRENGGEHGTCNWLGMGGKVIKIEYGSGVCRPSEEHISEKAYFWLTLDITLVENDADPYA